MNAECWGIRVPGGAQVGVARRMYADDVIDRYLHTQQLLADTGL